MNPLLKKAILKPYEFNLSAKAAWKQYQDHGIHSNDSIRHEIYESWENSKSLGVNPLQSKIQEVVTHHDLGNRLQQNEQLLSYATPKTTHILELLNESQTMLSITDRQGTILYSCGNRQTLKRAEALNISDGGTWSEKSAGTNAVGVTLKTKQSAQVLFSEHFCEKNHDWYCAATPIIAPFTKELLGIVNIAGSNPNLHPHTFKLIIAETQNVSNSIMGQVYESAVRDNLFLKNTIEVADEAILVVDSGKNIIERNIIAMTNPIISQVSQIQSLIGLEELLIHTMNGQNILNEEVKIKHSKQIFRCSIQPLSFQDIYLGAIITLRKTKSFSKHEHKPALKKTTNKKSDPFLNITGSSTSFSYVIKQAKKAAAIDATIFLSGETGTGKEVFAQSIHQASERRDHPFIAINCGAIPKGLLESELSGYEAGAFTGARAKGSPGKFEMAQGGTVFLDEIGDMPLDLQVHLLRILEEREVTRIGSAKPIPIDVRIIAATHRDLSQSVTDGLFREDLLYRLKIIQLTLPPLRERTSDISELSHRFINELSNQFGKQHVQITAETVQCLIDYHWPGNIRELRNVIQQALFNLEGEMLTPAHLPLELTSNLKQTDKEQLLESLQAENGVVTHAAKRLGVSRATMYRRMKQFNITAR
ncbi:sigma-54-dependent Fis family transcriptional regulator [Mammaliicoccus sciuri]|uniref:Transcriptional regulator of acetoin/glycerol metabolism n=2 Tax=Sporosarcina newyorkensis TaxID=759851 RepID=A0A1T4YUA7_9BACL|nr:sigma-54-dependent Fis family transcriptional regulator [Sporosarcina newyorkensis]EGQ25942.1 sigma-54 dependent transcriptional regulator [Sporosarcina newyorkensis 2681]SKB05306.1 Transcriptional regulator of acetoin/glycerol metabolism [Sporosarcina newyorkensis]